MYIAATVSGPRPLEHLYHGFLRCHPSTGSVDGLSYEFKGQPCQTRGVRLNPTSLHFHFHPLYQQSTKRPICWTAASVTVLLALSSSTCPNCHCVCVRPPRRPSQMPLDECGSTRGGTIKDSREDPKGFLRISDPSIKIEWGLNISTLKDNPVGSPFKTRAGCSRGISWCCPAEVSIGGLFIV